MVTIPPTYKSSFWAYTPNFLVFFIFYNFLKAVLEACFNTMIPAYNMGVAYPRQQSLKTSGKVMRKGFKQKDFVKIFKYWSSCELSWGGGAQGVGLYQPKVPTLEFVLVQVVIQSLYVNPFHAIFHSILRACDKRKVINMLAYSTPYA